MHIFGELQKAMRETEFDSIHHGYWYCISDVLTIIVCGMLCSLHTIDDIHEWSKFKPTRAFLQKEFKYRASSMPYAILQFIGLPKPREI